MVDHNLWLWTVSRLEFRGYPRERIKPNSMLHPPVQNPRKSSAEEKQNRTPWEMNAVGLNRPGQRGEPGPELGGDNLSTLGKRRACFLESCPQNGTGLGNFKPRGGLRAVPTLTDVRPHCHSMYRKCGNRVGGRQHASAAGGSLETIPSVSMYTMLTKVPTAGWDPQALSTGQPGCRHRRELLCGLRPRCRSNGGGSQLMDYPEGGGRSVQQTGRHHRT